MTKKEYCLNHKSIAYYSGLNGLEIKGIEYGIEDYIYCVSGCWYGGEKAREYHRVKIQYDRFGDPFFRIHGYKIQLDECIRMGAC